MGCYKVRLYKNQIPFMEFASIKETATYVQEKCLELIPERWWDIVNFGIDDGKPWFYEGDSYLISTSEDVKMKRASRITRKKFNWNAVWLTKQNFLYYGSEQRKSEKINILPLSNRCKAIFQIKWWNGRGKNEWRKLKR